MRVLLFIFFGFMSLSAHFLTLLPSSDNIQSKDESLITLEAMFIHPFMQTGMMMEKPQGIYLNNVKTPLPLTQAKKFDKQAWRTNYKIKRPGVYTFFTVPKPYFEASEEKFISHVPKVIVSAYGLEEGWDKPLGLNYEIVPLVKPFGLYAGNLFQGKVLHKGKPVSNVTVEVELYNEIGLKAPSSSHITQSVTTNNEGIFSFVMNQKGWWGFAALIMEGSKIHDNKEYEIENGALLWIKAY